LSLILPLNAKFVIRMRLIHIHGMISLNKEL